MRFLVIGNSHVAAIKQAYDAGLAGSGVDVEFFAGLARKIYRFRFSDDGRSFGAIEGRASPALIDKTRSLNGRATVDLADVSHVHLAGLRNCTIEHLSSLRDYSVDTLFDAPRSGAMSAAMFERHYRDLIRDFLPVKGWSRRKGMTVSVSPPPRFANWFPASKISGGEKLRLRIEHDGARGLAAFFEARDAIWEEELAARDILFVRQPPETLDDAGLTRTEFMAGAVRITGEDKGEDDFRHGNRKLGALCLDRVLQAHGVAAGTAPAPG